VRKNSDWELVAIVVVVILAVMLVVLALYNYGQAMDACEKANGVLVRKATGGVVCVQEKP